MVNGRQIRFRVCDREAAARVMRKGFQKSGNQLNEGPCAAVWNAYSKAAGRGGGRRQPMFLPGLKAKHPDSVPLALALAHASAQNVRLSSLPSSF